MSGGSTLPYGNVKNLFILSCAPAGANVTATSIYIPSVTLATVGGIAGTVISFNVPGVLPGDAVLDINRPSSTVNGATGQTYVGVGNGYVYAANNVSCVLTNSSIGVYVTTPIENYVIAIGRPDTTNPPISTPSGVY